MKNAKIVRKVSGLLNLEKHDVMVYVKDGNLIIQELNSSMFFEFTPEQLVDISLFFIKEQISGEN